MLTLTSTPHDLIHQIHTLFKMGVDVSDLDEKYCIDSMILQKIIELKSRLFNPDQQPNPAPLYAPYDGGLPLGDRIQLARENIGLSEAGLAQVLNVTHSNVNAWEDGSSVPGCDKLIPLAAALKCHPMWLLTGENISAAVEA